MAIKGKDLSYEAQEPAFLRRLRAQQAGDGDPDRHERPIARPTRMKSANADEDDGPTIVDEGNNTLSKEAYEAMLEDENNTATGKEQVFRSETLEKSGEGVEQTSVASERSKQEVSQAGEAQKKRKAARIVGADDVGSEDATAVETSKKPKTTNSKPKKKTKTVALSFDDGDG